MSSPRRLRSRALAVLALFATTNALPRPGLYAHHHAGGDRAHVHPWGEDAFEDDAHDDHAPRVADGRPGFEDADDDHGIHVHSQTPFQHTTKPGSPRLAFTALVRDLFAAAPVSSPVEQVPSSFARGPPPTTVS